MKSAVGRGIVISASVAMAVTVGMAPSASADPVGPRAVVDTAPSWTAHSAKLAETPASTRQQMTIVLKLRDAVGAEALATAVSDPASSQYGQFVSAATWRARFAPTSSTVKQVTDWLRAQGFTIGAIPANHRTISFSGSSAQAEQAFATDLKVFLKDGQRVSAPASALTVPTSLAGAIADVGGLDKSALVQPASVGGSEKKHKAKPTTVGAAAPTTVLPPPEAVFKNAPPCSSYYGQKVASGLPTILGKTSFPYAPCGYKPAQLRGAYGLDDSLNSGYDGRGVTVAVVDAYASPYILKDAQTYATRNDPSHPLRDYQFAQSLPASYSAIDDCDAAGWYGEETLDVEAVHATAPAANILYVGGTSCYDDDLDAAVNTVVDNELADIITNSYGDEGEQVATAAVHQTFLQAAAEGISVLFSSGDSGDEIANLGYRTVDYAASDPFVTAVGGTSLAVGPQNTYQWEQGWGTGKSTLKARAWDPATPAYLYGGGGGTSRVFTQPNYQKNVVPAAIANYFPGRAGRAVPDVSMVGDPNTGMLIGQSQTFPDGSVRYSEYRIGGTSLSSPLFAGVTAVADQWHGGSLGFLNPKLYKLAGTSAFREIKHDRSITDAVIRVDFVNQFDASGGTTTSIRTINQTGTIYTRPGYDDVTGVGSPRGLNFLVGMASGRSQTWGHSGGPVQTPYQLVPRA